MENSLDADETPHSAETYLGLHCLRRPVCPNTYRTYRTATDFAYEVLATSTEGTAVAKEAEVREAGPLGNADHSVSDKPEVLSCKGYLKNGCAKDTLNFWTRGGKLRMDRRAKTRRLIKVLPYLLRIQQFYTHSAEERE